MYKQRLSSASLGGLFFGSHTNKGYVDGAKYKSWREISALFQENEHLLRQQSDNFSYELYVLNVSQEGVSPLSITSSYFIIRLVRLPGHSANFKADVLVTGGTFAKLASVWQRAGFPSSCVLALKLRTTRELSRSCDEIVLAYSKIQGIH